MERVMSAAAVASSGWSFSAIGTQLANLFGPSTTSSSLVEIKIAGGGWTLADVTAHLQRMDLNWGYDALKLILMAQIAQRSYNPGSIQSETAGYTKKPELKDRCREFINCMGTMLFAAALIETAGNLRNWNTEKLLYSVATTAALSAVDGAASFRLTRDNLRPGYGKLRRWTPTILATLWLAGRIGYQHPIFAKAMNSLVA